MKEQKPSKEKYCGNCYHHSTYQYPGKIFCMFYFMEQEKSIFSTLYVCENWKTDYQECFCVREALKKRNR